jgi:hypothetical protein
MNIQFWCKNYLKKATKCLLPGELLTFHGWLDVKSKFDDSLLGEPIFLDFKQETIATVYERLKNEFKFKYS